MEDTFDDYQEVFSQDGVLLIQAPSAFIPFINSIGTLYIWGTIESDGSRNRKMFMEWKPNDITVDSEVQDQEWAVVNTVQKRVRTLSGNLPPDYFTKGKHLRISFSEIKSFRISKQNRQLTFNDGTSEAICAFLFQHGDCTFLVGILKSLLRLGQAKRDKHLFIVYDAESPEYQELNKTFAALDLKSETSLWAMFRNIKDHPYEGSLEAFSKVTNYVYRSVDSCENDMIDTEDLTQSLSEIDDSTSHSQGEYEVVQKLPLLPPRKEFPRCKPLTVEQWNGQIDSTGKLEDVASIKNLIFCGGVTPLIRKEVWKFLLDYYPWDSTDEERCKLVAEKRDEYYKMKLQWKSMSKTQETNFSDYSQRKSLIEKDVNRTDRNLKYYAGDDNFNLVKLNDILMTYVMYNFDLGYVQGMSDLLSPILMLIEDETESFWCFVGFMNKISSNFDIDQAGMKEQLGNLFTLLSFVDPRLANYLESHETGNMFFCFRWLLVWFKRELSPDEVMSFWEVLWTGYPCKNFHLLVAVAILEYERSALMSNNYGFTEILKYINELNGNMDMPLMLSKAEGIFHQIKEAEHLTDNIRIILGLSLLGNRPASGNATTAAIDVTDQSEPRCSVENVHISLSPDDITFDKSIQSNFL